MRLLIAQYLRLLKERDELDALIPTLFQSMGLTPISRPQTGARQDGVDIAAVGKDPSDGIEKLFLAVVKKGNIGRTDWSSGPQAVRPSLDEVFDVYLQNNVHPEHKTLPISIWVCTSGDLLQAVNENFVGYAKSKESLAEILFCGADRLAELIDQYLLNENLFLGEDRKFLRKALVLIGDMEYDLSDYHELLRSQLKISQNGEVESQSESQLQAALTRIHLALNILIAWGDDAKNHKQPFNAVERTLLWAWHAMFKLDLLDNKKIVEKYASIYSTYLRIALLYLRKVSQHFVTEDGMSKVSSDSALISISIFRQISILASVGISAFSIARGGDLEKIKPTIEEIAYLLCSIIANNQASSSPRLDDNSIDINLALIFFIINGDVDFAKEWLRNLVSKVYFAITKKQNYPISSDNLEELAQIEHGTFGEEKLMLGATWLIPSLVIWCTLLDMEEEYSCLTQKIIAPNSDLAPQLWHPIEDAYDNFYFGASALSQGETEVNINFELRLLEMKEKISRFRSVERFDIFKFSPALKKNLLGIELLACKHFRIPVPPMFIYSWLADGDNASETKGEPFTDASPHTPLTPR